MKPSCTSVSCGGGGREGGMELTLTGYGRELYIHLQLG